MVHTVSVLHKPCDDVDSFLQGDHFISFKGKKNTYMGNFFLLPISITFFRKKDRFQAISRVKLMCQIMCQIMSIFDEAEVWLWPWPSRDSEWYFVSFFHAFRFENNWVFKAPTIFRDVKISQNYITLSIYSFFIRFISLKTKFYWFEAIGVKGQLILKCLLVFQNIFWDGHKILRNLDRRFDC